MQDNLSEDWRENGPVESGEVVEDEDSFAVEVIEYCEFCGKRIVNDSCACAEEE